jgi:hypothetical protein
VKIWDLTQPIRAQSLELVFDYQASLSSPDETVPEPGPTAPLEERMERLQRLYDKGLITQEEYQLKRQSLLDEL